MHDMSDYIKLIARGIGRNIKDKDARDLAHELVRSKLYKQIQDTLTLKIKDITDEYDNDSIYEKYINSFDLGGYDELLPEVLQYILGEETVSTSTLQRKYRIGYSRSARMIDTLELIGAISSYQAATPRYVLVTIETILDTVNQNDVHIYND